MHPPGVRAGAATRPAGFQTFDCGAATLDGQFPCYEYPTYRNGRVKFSANVVAANWINPGSLSATLSGWCSMSSGTDWFVFGDATNRACEKWVEIPKGFCLSPSERLRVHFNGANAPRDLIVVKIAVLCPDQLGA